MYDHPVANHLLISKTSRRYAKVRKGTRRYPTRLSQFGYLHPEFEVLAGTRWYATVREGISGDVSWYPKVRGGTRRHRVDACAILLMARRPPPRPPRHCYLCTYVTPWTVFYRPRN